MMLITLLFLFADMNADVRALLPPCLAGGDARTEFQSVFDVRPTGGDCGGQRRSWTVHEGAQVTRGGVELAVGGRLRIGVGDELGDFGRETDALEHGLVGSLGQIIVDDPLARLLAHLGGELRHGECNVTTELVDLAGAARGREDDGCGVGEVRPRGSRVASIM
jgi:hypothetical protein